MHNTKEGSLRIVSGDTVGVLFPEVSQSQLSRWISPSRLNTHVKSLTRGLDLQYLRQKCWLSYASLLGFSRTPMLECWH